MHYFVDGYNLLFRSRLEQPLLQQQRERVIADLLEKVTVLELDITLVFDSAHTPELSRRQHIGRLEIAYTNPGETADAYILSELLRDEARQRHTVITSDKALAEQARRLGAKSMSVENFTLWLEARYQKMRGKRIKTLPVVPPATPAPKSRPIEDPYLNIFEQRLQKLVKPSPATTSRPTSAPEPPRQRKSEAAKKPPESDFERWLRLFEAGDS
jgi:predicted RNA-binding protein with PIN domain